MLDLANELRRLCDEAPEQSSLVTMQLFGVKHAERLKNLVISEVCKLASLAGLKNSLGYDIRKGVNLSKFVSIKTFDAQTSNFTRRSSNIDEAVFKKLASELKMACGAAPRGNTLNTVMLFGIKHAEEIKDYTYDDLFKLCIMAGIRKQHGAEIRKGYRLSAYVDFGRYPTEN